MTSDTLVHPAHLNGHVSAPLEAGDTIRFINLKLAALGQPVFGNLKDPGLVEMAMPFLRNHQEKNRLLLNYAPPIDRRIQDFLNSYLSDIKPSVQVKLPIAFILDRPGLARALSLPPDKDHFASDIVDTYRVKQGVLHNPKNDRRTTQGVFHVAEGGLAIPDDKTAVAKHVFAQLLLNALKPPRELLQLPFTASQEKKAEIFVSLLMRPIVCPATPGGRDKSMEVRFFAPGNLVGNLDFVEMIFGNGGDPYLPENDSAMDVDGWTGHTGCVILAPHLTKFTKKELGLPHVSEATERQRRDRQCWKDEKELYNDGQAFKVTCRDARGVMVTVIADNYFGYCKKEVKTQISFAANLYGLAEEEHSGGAIAYPSYILGRTFISEASTFQKKHTFAQGMQVLKSGVEVKPEGHAIDKRFPNVIYVPEDSTFDARLQTVTWKNNGVDKTIKLLAHQTFILPSGYKVRMKKQIGGPYWRLIGTAADGTLCHKPCTVSGGGKSEISKSIAYSMLQGPVFVRSFQEDFDEVEKILKRDFSDIYVNPPTKSPKRALLSPRRSLGSVVKLLTPSSDYIEAHNTWINSIPQTIRTLVFVVKRYYKQEWGDNWRQHFNVDRINGFLGHELRYDDQKLVANYLRVGHDKDGAWRIFKVRPDFNPADKVQVEDDITASVVIPREQLNDLDPLFDHKSVKLVRNCESYLFQRPDDAVIRGYDKQAEADLATPGTFLSNWQPLTLPEVKDLAENIINFDDYTEPMKSLLENFIKDETPDYVVSSAHSRLVDGKPTKNPRYLQKRPDRVNAEETHAAEMAARLSRGISIEKPVYFPVNAVVAGRRNNPPDLEAKIPPLAVYNPIHYQELPELFMDFISCLTGKSPSTTGFGSEGALTKGPFNALWPIVDLNNALVSYIVTGYPGFTTAAGYIGPTIQVEHDISLLIPEIWCRMKPKEQDPSFLIKNGHLEKVNDFEHKGKTVLASRLGYRITSRFVELFLGRLFESPNAVFSEEMLRPEKQDLDMYADGINEIVATQKRVAENYFKDGSVDAACPPLKALLHIMVHGNYEGKDITHPDIRNLFTRKEMLKSAWYKERLQMRQKREIRLLTNFVDYIDRFQARPENIETVTNLNLRDRLESAKEKLAQVSQPTYLTQLIGTIGADPFHKQA